MTRPSAEDTPLMGPDSSPYQGEDIEHQGDASFEEVQDIGRSRFTKSRLLLAMALLVGTAVAGFSGGLSLTPARAYYGWGKWGGKHSGKGAKKGAKKAPKPKFNPANYTGPYEYEVKMHALEKKLGEAAEKEKEVVNEVAAATYKAKNDLAVKEAAAGKKVLGEYETELKKLKADKLKELQGMDKDLMTAADKDLKAKIADLVAQKKKVEGTVETLYQDAQQEESLRKKEGKITSKQDKLREKEMEELAKINGV